MDKREAFDIVFHELIKIPMFTGVYDAKNGKEDYMYGIQVVMERIAYELDDNEFLLDSFSDFFTHNMIISEAKAGKIKN